MNGQLELVTEQSWSERARAWIEHLSSGDEFTAETVRRAVGDPETANQVGAAIIWAQRRGLILYAREDTKAARSMARGRWLRRWARTDKEAA